MKPVSLDRVVEDAEGHETPAGELRADPDSEWSGSVWPGEPRWERPPRDDAEAYARAEAVAAFWRAMMRAPYSTGYRRKRRPFLVTDMIRSGQAVGTPLECRDCHKAFTRRGSRGPVPVLCPECAEASRNGVPRVSNG